MSMDWRATTTSRVLRCGEVSLVPPRDSAVILRKNGRRIAESDAERWGEGELDGPMPRRSRRPHCDQPFWLHDMEREVDITFD